MIELVDAALDHPRGGAPLFAGANLKVVRGEVVLIVGAADVGTSRLAAAAMGDAPLTRGRLEILGHDVSKLRRSSLRLLRRRIGIVPQALCLLEDRSAQLNVVLPLEIDGVPRSISVLRAAEVLTFLDLESEASLPVDCLSAAARQRVAVARALVRDPDLVIADHPTTAQDALGTDLVCTALQAAATRGAACVVLGREPALRRIADLYGWRQLGLVGGQLVPVEELERGGRTLEEVLDGVPAAPAAAARAPVLPNVVPFPLGARAAAGGIR
ncbi:MAG TPA: ATP-binding cassette domain-containing protein [Kofleriaceae bacterium]|nr:ATP-binding cassette domain-containing protein [Kofleriaceae bacterium]